MAELKEAEVDLTEAMKSRDKLRTATLRMLLAAIQTEGCPASRRRNSPMGTSRKCWHANRRSAAGGRDLHPERAW